MATRILTAIVGCIIAVIVLFFANTVVLNIAISIVSMIIIYELFRAEKCQEFKLSFIVCTIYVGLMPFFSIAPLYKFRYIFAAFCVFMLFILFLKDHEKLKFEKLTFMITTSTLVSLSMCCLILAKNLSEIHGIFYLIFIFGAAWFADGGAYFIGTFFGKHKLCPKISPKKTVEGAIGGLVINVIVLMLISFVYMKYQATQNIHFEVNYLAVGILAAICSALSILGDLSASLLKRQCEIKDYGSIMPGHGGILDRFDSVLFVAPFLGMVLGYVKIFN